MNDNGYREEKGRTENRQSYRRWSPVDMDDLGAMRSAAGMDMSFLNAIKMSQDYCDPHLEKRKDKLRAKELKRSPASTVIDDGQMSSRAKPRSPVCAGIATSFTNAVIMSSLMGDQTIQDEVAQYRDRSHLGAKTHEREHRDRDRSGKTRRRKEDDGDASSCSRTSASGGYPGGLDRRPAGVSSHRTGMADLELHCLDDVTKAQMHAFRLENREMGDYDARSRQKLGRPHSSPGMGRNFEM